MAERTPHSCNGTNGGEKSLIGAMGSLKKRDTSTEVSYHRYRWMEVSSVKI